MTHDPEIIIGGCEKGMNVDFSFWLSGQLNVGLSPFYLHLFAWAGHTSVTYYREMSNYSDLDIGIIKF